MDQLQDLPAERAVLAGLMKHGREAYLDICTFIDDNTFTYDSNVKIWMCIKRAFMDESVDKIDFTSIEVAAHDLGIKSIIDDKTETMHLRAIQNFPVELPNVRRFAAKIRRLQVTRLMISQLGGAIEKLQNVTGTERMSELLAIPEDVVFNFSSLMQEGDNEPSKLGDEIEAYIEDLIANPVKQLGLQIGMPLLEKALGGGPRKGGVTLIGARAKTGKTALSDNIGHFVSQRGIPTLNADTEMQKGDHYSRMLAMLCEVEINEIATGQFGQDVVGRQKVREAGKKIKGIPYFHKSISGLPFEEQLAVMRRWIVKEVGLNPDGTAKDCLIIYDYIKLMDSEGLKNMQEYQLLGFMMTALHNFAVRYNIPIISFVQLNRDGITSEGAEAAAGSDRIIHLCSSFTIFKWKSDEERSEDGPEGGTHKMIVVLARYGPGTEDKDYINISMKRQYAQIKEIGLRTQLPKRKKKSKSKSDDDGFEADVNEDQDFNS